MKGIETRAGILTESYCLESRVYAVSNRLKAEPRHNISAFELTGETPVAPGQGRCRRKNRLGSRMGTIVTFSLVLVFTETAIPRGVQTTGGVMFVVDSTWNPAGAIGQVITASAFVWEMSSATLKNSNANAYVSL